MKLCACFLMTFLVLGANSLILLSEKECPPIREDQLANRVCSSDADCSRTQRCCQTGCEDIRDDCNVNGEVFPHHAFIPSQLALEEDQCGMCFCNDAEVQCYIHPCPRPGQPQVVS